jgi:hypothetical protein
MPAVDSTTEEWKPIDGFAAYEISSHGRVKRVALVARKKTAGNILRPWTHTSGHLYVSLGRGHKRQVHRLVLFAFVGPQPSDSHESCHRDSNPINNHAENLYWGTRLENIIDTIRHRDRAPSAITTVTIANELRAKYSGVRGGVQALATEYGLPHSVVWRIVHGWTYNRTT